MANPKSISVDPTHTKSIAEAVNDLLTIVRRQISIGDPLDPASDQSTVLAGGVGLGSHNGRPSNIEGTWVEVEFEALHTAVACTHNLGVPVTNGEVNVRWIVMGIRHSGAGVLVGGNLPISVNFQDGDTITTNSIQLRAYSAITGASSRTVNADNPIRVSLRMFPVTRWPN